LQIFTIVINIGSNMMAINGTQSIQASDALPIRMPQFIISSFCKRHHIRKLSLFGSVTRDDFRPDSDVDVLVEFEPGHVPGFGIVTMEAELSAIFQRNVDLRTPKDLSRYFREQVVREAKVQYEVT
jgi:predicted nucleotidyltransferase